MGIRSVSGAAAGLLGREPYHFVPSTEYKILDARGFSRIVTLMSSGSTDLTLTVSRVRSSTATAVYSTTSSWHYTVSGSSEAARDITDLDWPIYHVALTSTGSTGGNATVALV